MPPQQAIRKAAALLGRTLAARWKAMERHGRSYDSWHMAQGLKPCCGDLSLSCSAATQQQLAAAGEHILAHQFDLLGSGAVVVCHGMTCKGAQHPLSRKTAIWAAESRPHAAYPPQPNNSAWLRPRISKRNWHRAQQLWNLLPADYLPIDWQLDFKSGFRWNEHCWHTDIRYGQQEGVDVKVPWELGRLQHLPQLALCWRLAQQNTSNFRSPQAYLQEFRSQVLDFLACNPPGFGVQWACPMDVAIRGANLCIAWSLFHSDTNPPAFDVPFTQALAAAAYSHARQVFRNLEWHPHWRANHYLADIAGLAVLSAHLTSALPAVPGWRSFAAHALAAEIPRQFDEQGANFEASTCYHRLSVEMVCWALACLLPEQIQPFHQLSPLLPQRLAGMDAFLQHSTAPDNSLLQIGDNDSGRFLILCPDWHPRQPHATQGALAALLQHRLPEHPLAKLNHQVLQSFLQPTTAKTIHQHAALPLSIQHWRHSPTPDQQHFKPAHILQITPQKQSPLTQQLSLTAYPHFGLFIWSSPRLFLAVRCGQVGQNGNGGHAHNDQLSLSLFIDKIPWLQDPGTGLYTPFPQLRNSYRSALAHNGPANPQPHNPEPNNLQAGLFTMPDQAKPICITASTHIFQGMHYGFSQPVMRTLQIKANTIVLTDSHPYPHHTPEPITIASPQQLQQALQPLAPPFSPNYGEFTL